jgi:hypothetical protein
MSGTPSPYVLNLVELQNVVTNSSGVDPAKFLSNQLANIQQMVNYDLKQINVNAISNFSQTPIQVYSPLNLCNVTLSQNGSVISGGSGISTIGTSTVSLAIGLPSTNFLFEQGGTQSFWIGADCNANFVGSVTAANFITSSDRRRKIAISPVTDYETILSSIHGVRFQWYNTGVKDIGVIAQDVLPVLPEAVIDMGTSGLAMSYTKLIPVLIEAVKALQVRVSTLEGGGQKPSLREGFLPLAPCP